jgi:hypothetical protein
MGKGVVRWITNKLGRKQKVRVKHLKKWNERRRKEITPSLTRYWFKIDYKSKKFDAIKIEASIVGHFGQIAIFISAVEDFISNANLKSVTNVIGIENTVDSNMELNLSLGTVSFSGDIRFRKFWDEAMKLTGW